MGEVRGVLGQVVYQRDGKGTKVVRAPLHGVPVLRVALDPEGFWARRRAGRAARRLVRQGRHGCWCRRISPSGRS